MHPARKPLATLAITLGTFLIMLGAPALAGAGRQHSADAGTTAQASPAAELAAADDDTDGTTAIGADTDSTDGSADADGTALVGASVAVSADSVAAESVAVSGQIRRGHRRRRQWRQRECRRHRLPGANADADGTSVLGPDTDAANSNGNANGNANGGASANSNDGNSTGADGGGDPTPAANDPVLANNSGIAPAAAPEHRSPDSRDGWSRLDDRPDDRYRAHPHRHRVLGVRPRPRPGPPPRLTTDPHG